MDEIRQKLALIDKELAGRLWHKKIAATCPLVFCAVGLIAGILLQTIFVWPVWFWGLLLIVSVTAAALLYAGQIKNKLSFYTPAAIGLCALICFSCFGAARLIYYQKPSPRDIRRIVTDQKKLATVRGIIISKPHINRHENWYFARFAFSDPGTSFYMKLDTARTNKGWASLTGNIKVYVDEPVLDLHAGDYVQIYCWLDRFKHATNPGQFDVAKYLARRNIFVLAAVKSTDAIKLLEPGTKDLFARLKSKLQNLATLALIGSPVAETDSQGLLQALLLGYRKNISSETYRAFRSTGLLHFISLSGMHLGIFVGIVWWLTKTAGLMKPDRACCCLAAITIFLLIVPLRAPTVRAAIIAALFCTAVILRRRTNSLNTLSMAAIILLLIRPTNLFEAGWQLSFVSVLGLVLFCHRIHFFIYEKIRRRKPTKKNSKSQPYYSIVSRQGPYFLRLLSTGFTAWLSGAGILLYHFGTITPLTFIWTVIVFPFIVLILTLGYLTIVFSLFLQNIAFLIGWALNFMSATLIELVGFIDGLNISEILIGHVPLALVIIYYCFVLFAAYASLRSPRTKKLICAAMMLLIITFIGGIKWQKNHSKCLTLTTLDVGHGQAVLLQLPGGKNLLFDAGSLFKANVGDRIINPFLNYHGLTKLDYLIISHNDVDHINGIPEIATTHNVGRILTNPTFSEKADRYGTAKALKKVLNEKNNSPTQLKTNIQHEDARVSFIWPTKQAAANPQLTDNDKSLVALIEFAGRKILLCSDIEQLTQQKLLKLYPQINTDILLLPHHGSSNTTEPRFLEKLDAKIWICSCGDRQYRNHNTIKPNPATKAFYTPANGAITASIDKNGNITVTTYLEKKTALKNKGRN